MIFNLGVILALFSFFISSCSPAVHLAKPSRDVALPPLDDLPKMARYIVHNADWTVISHISHQGNSSGYPLGRVWSMSDGPVANSSGTPYIYTTLLDPVAKDLVIDNLCGMTMSLVQGSYCKERNFDPEDPLCAQVMMTGHFEFIDSNSTEASFAKEALFSRHPEMKTWPASHNFKFGKLNIVHIQMIDYYGGSKYPSVQEYYNANL